MLIHGLSTVHTFEIYIKLLVNCHMYLYTLQPFLQDDAPPAGSCIASEL